MTTAVVITAETQQAIERIEAFAKKLEGLESRAQRSGAAASQASTGVDVFNAALTRIVGVAATAFSVDSVVRFGQAVYRETLEAERSVNLLNGTLRATGYAAGKTSGDINQLVDRLSAISNFEDDSISQAATAMLRFRDIQGATFDRGMELAVDFAAAMGTDVVSAAQAVGRALQSPGEGMRALQAAGVKLSPMQKELAERLAETGDKAGAQKIVLDALAKSVGGSASDQKSGLGGASASLAKSWDNLLETVGKTDAVSKFIPYTFDQIAYKVSLASEALDGFGKFWNKYLAAGQASKSWAQLDAEEKAANAATAAEKKAAEEKEKAKAEAGAAEQKRLQDEEVAAERRKKLQEEQAKAAEKAQAAYDNLMKSMREKRALDEAELANGKPLTEAQKLRVELESEIDKTVGKGNTTKRAAAQAEKELTVAKREGVTAQREWAKFQEDADKAVAGRLDTLQKEAEKLEAEVASYGKLGSEIEATTIARLEEDRAKVKSLGATDEQLKKLDEEIALRKRIAASKGQKEDLDADKKAREAADAAAKKSAEEVAREWQRGWEETDRLAREVFADWATHGGNAAEKIGEALKSALLSAVYEATLKPLAFQIYTSATGAMGVPGAPGASGGGIGGSTVNPFGSFSTTPFEDSLYDFAISDFGEKVGFGDFMASGSGQMLDDAAGFLDSYGGYIKAAYDLSQGNYGSAVGTAIGAAVAGPIGAAIGGALGSMLDGGGGEDPHTNPQTTGYNFALSSAGVSGVGYYEDRDTSYAGDGPTAFIGGPTSGSGWWGDTSAMSAEMVSAINAQVATTFADATKFAQQLGLSTAGLADVSVSSLTDGVESDKLGNYFPSVEAAFVALNDEISLALLPNIKDFQASGESLTQTLMRLAAVSQAVDTWGARLGFTLGDLTDKNALASAFGGSANMDTALGAYYQSYYSEAERTARMGVELTTAFASLNTQIPTSKDSLRALIDATVDSGAGWEQTYASLIALSGPFSEYITALEASGQAATVSAEALRMRQDWQNKLDVLQGRSTQEQIDRARDLASTTDAATQALMNQVFAEQDLAASVQAAVDAMQASADAMIAQFGDLAGALLEINPPAELLVDAWHRTKEELVSLTQGLADALGQLPPATSLDALSATMTTIASVATGMASISDQIFALQTGKGDQAAIDQLKAYEQVLFAELATSADPASIAEELASVITQRITAEGALEATAMEPALQAEYDAAVELAELEQQAREDQITALQEQIGAAEQLVDVVASLNDYISQLKFGDLSPLNPLDQLNEAQSYFNDTVAGIDLADPSTLAELQNAATSYLQELQSYNGGATSPYVSGYNEVMAVLDEYGTTPITDTALLQSQLDALEAIEASTIEMQEAVVDTTDRQIEALSTINVALAERDAELQKQQAEQKKAVENQIALLEQTVANQEAQITQNAAAYQALLDQLAAINASVTALEKNALLTSAAPA